MAKRWIRCGNLWVFVLNLEKAEGSAQAMDFLGMWIDSIHCVVKCTQQRRGKLRTQLMTWLQGRTVTTTALKQFAHKLLFCSQVMKGSSAFTSPLFTKLAHAEHSKVVWIPIERSITAVARNVVQVI